MTDRTYCIDSTGKVICALGDPRAVAVLQWADAVEQWGVEDAIKAGAVIDEGSFKTDWRAKSEAKANEAKQAALEGVAEWHKSEAERLVDKVSSRKSKGKGNASNVG